MDEFVKALIHVYNSTDVVVQWKRATDSVELMSNLDSAVAWKRLSHHASKKDMPSSLSEMKVLYKRAIREGIGSSEHAHHTGESYTNVSSHLKHLANEINAIRTVITVNSDKDNIHQIQHSLDNLPFGSTPVNDSRPDSRSSTPKLTETLPKGGVTDAAKINVTELPTEPSQAKTSANTAKTHAEPSQVKAPANTAMEDIIKACCTDTKSSIDKLHAKLDGFKVELIEKWENGNVASEQRATQNRDVLLQAVNKQFETQNDQIIEELTKQLDAVANHETNMLEINEKIGNTLGTIVGILQEHGERAKAVSSQNTQLIEKISDALDLSKQDADTFRDATLAHERGQEAKMRELVSTTATGYSAIRDVMVALKEKHIEADEHNAVLHTETHEKLSTIQELLNKIVPYTSTESTPPIMPDDHDAAAANVTDDSESIDNFDDIDKIPQEIESDTSNAISHILESRLKKITDKDTKENLTPDNLNDIIDSLTKEICIVIKKDTAKGESTSTHAQSVSRLRPSTRRMRLGDHVLMESQRYKGYLSEEAQTEEIRKARLRR